MDWLRRTTSSGTQKAAPEGVDPARIPAHQIVTDKFPVMTFGGTPSTSTGDWRLKLFGLVEAEIELDWQQLMALEQTAATEDFHCVTQWSRLDVTWEGVRASVVLDLCRPLAGATHAMVHCYDGYSTNVDLEVLRRPDVLFAHTQFGSPIKREHGAPVRLLVPSRYGWKSAKWVNAVELMAGDRPGFWEERGYHMRGDFWAEERFGRPF